MNKVMVLKGGSSALHKLGDIGRDEDSFIRVFDYDDGYYTGNFEEGFGFIGIKFRAKDCRALTPEEVNSLDGKWYAVNNHIRWQIHIDADGNMVTA